MNSIVDETYSTRLHSQFPGALFGRGDHDIRYEATTTDGLKLHCNFQIHVKGKPTTVEPKIWIYFVSLIPF